MECTAESARVAWVLLSIAMKIKFDSEHVRWFGNRESETAESNRTKWIGNIKYCHGRNGTCLLFVVDLLYWLY